MALNPTRNRVGLLKMETTYAVDPVPAAANAMLFMNSSIAPMADKLERPLDHAYYGNNPFVLVGKRVEFTAEVDLLGALTVASAAPLGPLYRTCGLAETLVAAPLTTPVNSAFTTSTTGGTVPAGTWFYRVSAYNANGETLASTETSQVTTGATSTVTVNWGSVAGAVGYRVYGRSLTGAELFLADAGNALTYIDNGSITPAGALPAANTTTGTAYMPISTGFESSALYFYEGGMLFKMTGIRGYFDWDVTIKTYAKAKVKLTGILTIPSDAAFPAGIDWTPFQNPMAVQTESWVVNAGGILVNALSLSVNCGQQVVIHEGSETREIYISDRKPTGTLRVMKDLNLATWNPWQIADDQGQGKIGPIILRNQIIGTTGKQVNNQMRLQLEYPKPVDDGGIIAYDIPFSLIPSSAGNDEFMFGFN